MAIASAIAIAIAQGTAFAFANAIAIASGAVDGGDCDLFANAKNLAYALAPEIDERESVALEPEVGDALKEQFTVKGGVWAERRNFYQVVVARSGKYSGLQAVGVASNVKARQRAARLALVVAARVQSGRAAGSSAENPALSGLVATY